MDYSLTYENGQYDISVSYRDKLNENKKIELGNLILDMKRRQYYILPADSENLEMTKTFKKLMIKLFIGKLSDRINVESMVGEMKIYAETILKELIKEYTISTKTNEEKIKEESISEIKDYNLVLTEENLVLR